MTKTTEFEFEGWYWGLPGALYFRGVHDNCYVGQGRLGHLYEVLPHVKNPSLSRRGASFFPKEYLT